MIHFAAGMFAGAAVGVMLAGLLARREIDEIRREHVLDIGSAPATVTEGSPEVADFEWDAFGVGGNP